MELPDIETKSDIEDLLNVFYNKLLEDEITAPIFNNLNMKEHIPVITNFWAMVLLGDISYQGNPFGKHVRLNLKKIHFEKWLHYFSETINSMHIGDKANLAKERARSISIIFQMKLGLIS